MPKHSVTYRARRQRMRRARKYRQCLARLEAFGRLHRQLVEEEERAAEAFKEWADDEARRQEGIK